MWTRAFSKMLVASRFSALLDAQGLLLFREVALLAWLEAWMPEHGSLHALEAVTAGAWFVTSPCGLSAYLRAGSRCGCLLLVAVRFGK